MLTMSSKLRKVISVLVLMWCASALKRHSVDESPLAVDPGPKKEESSTSPKSASPLASPSGAVLATSLQRSTSYSLSTDHDTVEISIDNKQYKLLVVIDKHNPNSQLFTNLTAKHTRCLTTNYEQCSESQRVINCQAPFCETLQKSDSDKHESVILQYSNNGNTVVAKFMCPQKMGGITDEYIGKINLFGESLVVKSDKIYVGSKSQFSLQPIDEKKQKTIKLFISKESEEDEEEEDQQQQPESHNFTIFSFDFNHPLTQHTVFSLPASVRDQLLTSIKSKLPTKCKLKTNMLKCKKTISIGELNQIQIRLCFMGELCVNLTAKDLIKQSESSDKTYEVLFSSTDSEEVILYYNLAKFAAIEVNSNGQVCGLTQSSKLNVKKSSASRQSKPEKQENGQQEDESEDEDENEDKDKEQKQGTKTGKKHMNKQDEDEQQEESSMSQTESEEQDDQQTKKTKKKQNHQASRLIQKSQQQKKPFSKSLLFLVVVYTSIIVLIIIVIKIKASESLAASAIDVLLAATWYKLVNSFEKRGKGYQPSSEQENEEIDHGNSMMMGYSEKQGKQLFWEKNSVEGI